MTYSDYLKSMGATDEDLKVLDHPVARKAFEAQQAAAEAEKASKLEYEAKANEWFEKTAVEVAKTNTDLAVSRANEARARALILAAKEAGMADLAKQAGYEPDPTANPNPNPAAPAFDASKFATPDMLIAMARKEGRAIAAMTRIAGEHARLFPNDAPPAWDTLYDEYSTSNPRGEKSFESFWSDRFKVGDARAAQSKATQDAREKKIADDAVAKARSEWAAAHGSNPDTRAFAPSTSPLTPRKEGARSRQPWMNDDGRAQEQVIDRSGERVSRVVTKVLSGELTPGRS